MTDSLKSSSSSITKDPGVPLWRTIKAKGSIPTPRSGHSGVVYRHNLYVFGGRDGNTFKNDVFAFHFVTNTWVEVTTHGARPQQRYGHRAVLYNGSMIVFGGHAANSYLNDLLELDLETKEWKVIDGGGQPPTPRWQHSMAMWRGELIIFGGCDSTSFLSDLYAFNFEHRFWRHILIDEYSIPPTPRMQHGSVIIGDRLYVFGGQSGDSVKNDLFEFNFDLSSWNFLGVFEDFFRRNFVCVEYGGNIIVMGGYSGGNLHNDVLQYNTDIGAWSQLVKVEGKPPSKRSGHCGDIYGNKMIVFGGLANDGSQNDLFELDLGSIDDESKDVEAELFSPPVLPSMLGVSPLEIGYLHRMRAGSSVERGDSFTLYNKDETPVLALYREEIEKLREELEAARMENIDLKREISSLKADKAALTEDSQYILI